MNVKSKDKQKGWFYTDIVKDHFFHPRNFMKPEEKEVFEKRANGIGESGSAVCGDLMRFWLVIDEKRGKIKECRWETFGCASAIASTSMLSVMITEKGGMNINDALKIKPQDIVKRLKGLPPIKIHCSILGDRALRNAIENYKKMKKLKNKNS